VLALLGLALALVGEARVREDAPRLLRKDAPRGSVLLPGEDGPRLSRAAYEAFEPFPFSRGRADELLERGRDGYAHVLYAKSPGGVVATARRVRGLSPHVTRAAERHGVEAEAVEALVFLESAGRPDAMAGGVEGAVGLGQILPETATSLLGMRVDVAASRRLTARIERARRRALLERLLGRRRRAERRLGRLERARRRVDERFDASKSLDGSARYLAFARERLGREDLALTSYHMGVGNLEDVIRLYVAPRRPHATTRETVEAYEITYPRLFFDSSPARNPRTFRRLASLGDDSRTYLFRLEAARQIMRLYGEDRDELVRLARLHGAKASAEEVLRPPNEHEPYGDPEALRAAWDDGELLPLPAQPRRLGLRIDSRLGALAPRLRQRPSLYSGLRPDALATMLYVAKETRRLAGGGALRVTSAVRDRRYQGLLVQSNREATRGYSLHTVGYAVDLARPTSETHERALVHVLERLRALAVIDWVYEPSAIHITVGPDGARYRPLLTRLAR
jgi:soluble lytic murein transglycosylase-like protein